MCAGHDTASVTWDDDWFETLAELDAIAYVGDAALTRLLGYAKAHPVPAGETVEGVTFAAWQSGRAGD